MRVTKSESRRDRQTMAYAPSTEPIPQAASANVNRTNKEEIGSRVIRNEKDWKWGKQVSITRVARSDRSMNQLNADNEIVKIMCNRKSTWIPFVMSRIIISFVENFVAFDGETNALLFPCSGWRWRTRRHREKLWKCGGSRCRLGRWNCSKLQVKSNCEVETRSLLHSASFFTFSLP